MKYSPKNIIEYMWYLAELKIDAAPDMNRKFINMGDPDTIGRKVHIIRIPSTIPVKRFKHGKFLIYSTERIWAYGLTASRVDESFDIIGIDPKNKQDELNYKMGKVINGSAANVIKAIVEKYNNII